MFSSSASQSSVFGYIHTFILGQHMTNKVHEPLIFFRRLMAMWLMRYKEDPHIDQTSHAHVPNVLSSDGLKDIIAVGNLLDLAGIIDHRAYLANGIPAKDRLEVGTCRSMYRQLQSVICRNFVIRVAGKPILPLLVFRRSLVEFAAAVVVYKENAEARFPNLATYSAARVKEKTLEHFRSNHPDLLPRLQDLIKNQFQYLYWTGPEISITEHTKDHCLFSFQKRNTAAMELNRKLRDFTDWPLYVSSGRDYSCRQDEVFGAGSGSVIGHQVDEATIEVQNDATTGVEERKEKGKKKAEEKKKGMQEKEKGKERERERGPDEKKVGKGKGKGKGNSRDKGGEKKGTKRRAVSPLLNMEGKRSSKHLKKV
jgi:hypothetical protein